MASGAQLCPAAVGPEGPGASTAFPSSAARTHPLSAQPHVLRTIKSKPEPLSFSDSGNFYSFFVIFPSLCLVPSGSTM